MKHMGFNAAAAKAAAGEGESMAAGRAMIGAAAHKASASAIRKNPRLKRVPGVGKDTEKSIKGQLKARYGG